MVAVKWRRSNPFAARERARLSSQRERSYNLAGKCLGCLFGGSGQTKKLLDFNPESQTLKLAKWLDVRLCIKCAYAKSTGPPAADSTRRRHMQAVIRWRGRQNLELRPEQDSSLYSTLVKFVCCLVQGEPGVFVACWPFSHTGRTERAIFRTGFDFAWLLIVWLAH